jgi:hypothetical protein|tara:strand:+ start:21 stop:506 length:486 start_codon:yes stop_codon:yes gene_type:complete
MNTTLYANPYDTSYTGFYFGSIDEFNKQLSQASYEEVEIDYIGGNNPKLFQAADIHQCNIDTWFDELDQYSDDGHEASAIGYLLDIMHLDEAIKRRDEVILHRGSLADYAFELVEDICSLDQLPDLIRNHIDYDSIARDLELNSEVTELSRNVWVVNCLEF